MHDLRRHANAARTGAADEKYLIGQFTTMIGRGQQTTQRHRARTLDVVIEARNGVAVALQHVKRSRFTEIFPLHHRFGEAFFECGNEGVNHLVVFRAASARLAHAEIKRVFEQFFIVRTKVKQHRQGLNWANACGQGVQSQFTDTNCNPAKTLIANTQNPLGVGHYRQLGRARIG